MLNLSPPSLYLYLLSLYIFNHLSIPIPNLYLYTKALRFWVAFESVKSWNWEITQWVNICHASVSLDSQDPHEAENGSVYLSAQAPYSSNMGVETKTCLDHIAYVKQDDPVSSKVWDED